MITFRFIAVYFSLHMFYTWLRFQTIPGLKQLHGFFWTPWHKIVEFANNNIFQISPVLVDPNNSTDTSFSWASQLTILLISVVAAIAWSVVDRKKVNYEKEEYWLRVASRYFIAYFCLYYGIIKLFGLQMPFPSLSQLSTTYGDLSPTRAMWLFFGASTGYQVFSGVIETSAGLFLMYRRTTTPGLILAFAVFANIVALNLFYDVSAKLMSIHFLIFIVYLLMPHAKRIIDFLLNKATSPTMSFEPGFTGNMKWVRIAAKAAFVYVAIIAIIILSIRTYRSYHLEVDTRPIEQGVYDVTQFSLSGDPSVHWDDLVLYGVTGSIKTPDTIFIQRYGRGYFSFEVDTVARQLKLKRDYYESKYITQLNYEIPDAGTLQLSGIIRSDTLRVTLKKSTKAFRLANDHFNWIQESTE